MVDPKKFRELGPKKLSKESKMILNEGGNVFQRSNGQIATTPINKADVAHTRLVGESNWFRTKSKHSWYNRTCTKIQVI